MIVFSSLIFFISLLLPGFLISAQPTSVSDDDLMELGIEDLLEQKVTTVSKASQRLFDTAAAVYVITQEDIRRSGSTNIPEVLRMVPGMQVAQVDASKWAVSARGFNSRFANKMLVLIDGRAVYTPIFSGTYWEAFELPLNDIKRIEVIRGPGASTWGANAVNGVINIITKRADETPGGLFNVIVGTGERANVDLRLGAQISEDMHIRAYTKYLKRDALQDMYDEDAGDDWRLKRGGFRADGRFSIRDIFMLQGDIYQSRLNQNYILPSLSSPLGVDRVMDKGSFAGGWLLGRWEQTQSSTSRTSLQISYQRELRDDLLGDYQLKTFDMDFQHEIALPENHELMWGLGYRSSGDDFKETPLLTVIPSRRDYDLFSAFLQDRVMILNSRVEVTLGSKFEYNSFTGWEIQPTLRSLWKPSAKDRVWMAVSRATRTPSRVENNGSLRVTGLPPGTFEPVSPLPGLVAFQGNSDLMSETLLSYELGYRCARANTLFIDISAFYNDYDELRTAGPLSTDQIKLGADRVEVTTEILNGEKARLYGLEFVADWHPVDRMRLMLNYSYLKGNYQSKSNNNGDIEWLKPIGEKRNPEHQLNLFSSFDITQKVEFDIWLRYVDGIDDLFTPAPPGVIDIDDYLTMDLRLGWNPHKDLSLSFSGKNLLDTPRVEMLQESSSFVTQVERGFYGQLQWRF